MSLRGAALAAAIAVLLAGCGKAKTEAVASGGVGSGCVSCHGSFDNAAPPTSLRGAASTGDLAVGAHQVHLTPGAFRKAVACDECHVVPTTAGAPGHIDLPGAAPTPADVVFGGLATNDGAAPVWNRAAAGCAASYCHGGTLAGGSNSAPIWTRVDGTQVACGTCHGLPPPTVRGGGAHPAATGSVPAACSACHPGTVRPDGTIDIVGGQHIDGVVQVGALACAGCHGDAGRTPASLVSAPPRDATAQHNTATTFVGVGAHQAHLVAGRLRGPLACAECHVVPPNLSGHPKLGGAVDITWGPLARAGGSAPSWSRATLSCAAAYCHGATLTGGTNIQPKWTQVDGTQAACGTCHGVPPPAPHPQQTGCGTCHTGYTATSVDVAIHVNGYVELNGARCTSCHGDAGRATNLQAAPPTDVRNNTATSAVGVGAHMQHVDPSLTKLRGPVPCTECHPLVTSTDHAVGKNLVVEMTWGPLATTDGVYPTWDRATAGCAASYCHGTTLSGGSNTSPIWTRVDGSQAACGTCHGVPPPVPHVQRLDCGTCHTGYTSTVVHMATHVNGVLDAITLRCTTCHGDATAPAPIAAAPPKGVLLETLPSTRAVGAHQKHLNDGVLRKAILCTECHPVPTVANHADGVVDVVFGPLARAGTATPTWNRAGLSCAASYCHGATLTGGSLRTPISWTRVDGTQVACGTCHGIPPPLPHVQSANCGGCHTGYTDKVVNVATHIDGTVQAVGGCTSCHGDAARTPAAIASAPPLDTRKNGATTFLSVGAHQAHLVANTIAAPIACTECHVVPADLTSHPNGTLDLTWGPTARADGAAPTYNPTTGGCAASYCHGSTMAGGSLTTPVWNKVDGTQAACGTCHGVPPPDATHTGVTTSCTPCHAAAYSAAGVDKALHVNGVVDASGGCTGCHGDPARTPAGIAAAPPKRFGGTLADPIGDRGVGAHLAHLVAGKMRGPMACSECHVVPATVAAPGHLDAVNATGSADVTFGPLARTGGAVPSWNTPNLSCGTTYCHGATLPNAATNGTNHTPAWTATSAANAAAQAACGTCHGIPPPSPHSQNTACGSCHTGYTATTVNMAQHVDGTVQAAAMTCTSCHGDPARVLVTGASAQTRSAPPVDTLGRTATTLRSVGAHVAHLNRAALGAPVACTECHPVPSSMTHANGTVAVAFGTLSKTRASNPTWNTTTLGCAATYCHGQGLKGGTKPTPVWTATGGLGCTTCHAAPPVDSCHPPAFNHDGGNACNACHKDTNSTGTAITNPRLHVNGVVNGWCSDCHAGMTRTCN